MKFKVGDRVLHIAGGSGKGTVEKLEDEYMYVLFDGDKYSTKCVQDPQYFQIIFRKPSKNEKEEWAALWDDGAE